MSKQQSFGRASIFGVTAALAACLCAYADDVANRTVRHADPHKLINFHMRLKFKDPTPEENRAQAEMDKRTQAEHVPRVFVTEIGRANDVMTVFRHNFIPVLSMSGHDVFAGATVRQVESAFQTTLNEYLPEGKAASESNWIFQTPTVGKSLARDVEFVDAPPVTTEVKGLPPQMP